MKRPALLVVAAACALSGCSTIDHKPRGFTQLVAASVPEPGAQSDAEKPRKIVIFFDGTANDEGSDTNVKRLHSLVTLQDRGDIASLYVLGVGTNLDAVGAATGAGINARARIAYEFVLNHYRPETQTRKADEVYIFGFSRGAFSARILTTMLYFAGIVEDTKSPRRHTSTEIAEEVHKALFPGFGQGDVDESVQRPSELADKLKREDLHSVTDHKDRIPVPVKVLGLWDTVEALGVLPMLGQRTKLAFRSTPPDVNIDNPNRRYGERLCNVEYAFHALSIDDNRATVFTPLLLSRAHLWRDCLGPEGYSKTSPGHAAFRSPMFDDAGRLKKGHLQEVWFSGAHADVGGGYLNGNLHGVSLNWMLERLNKATPDLVHKRVADAQEKDAPVRYVREDVFGGSHDPTTGIWAVYPRVTRDLVTYAFQKQSLWAAKLCVHPSVFARRSLIGYKDHEYDQLALNAPGTVQVAIGPYGKGRDWQWLRQWPAEEAPRVRGEIAVQQYPGCTFMDEPTRVGRAP